MSRPTARASRPCAICSSVRESGRWPCEGEREVTELVANTADDESIVEDSLSGDLDRIVRIRRKESSLASRA
jgi:hypothetical protein